MWYERIKWEISGWVNAGAKGRIHKLLMGKWTEECCRWLKTVEGLINGWENDWWIGRENKWMKGWLIEQWKNESVESDTVAKEKALNGRELIDEYTVCEYEQK